MWSHPEPVSRRPPLGTHAECGRLFSRSIKRERCAQDPINVSTSAQAPAVRIRNRSGNFGVTVILECAMGGIVQEGERSRRYRPDFGQTVPQVYVINPTIRRKSSNGTPRAVSVRPWPGRDPPRAGIADDQAALRSAITCSKKSLIGFDTSIKALVLTAWDTLTCSTPMSIRLRRKKHCRSKTCDGDLARSIR